MQSILKKLIFIQRRFEFDRIIVAIKKKYAPFSKIFNEHMECLVLEKEQSEDSLMQLCQQVDSIYVLINTTNNNDSPVKIEMDISYVHHQCTI
ncbi:unnamed protein product [Rotaria sordida]|uniref:Uncharacterized protein n=1 Tax=Rotaria sordida TaxID=392033 RepID=A0A814M116_9BILA|nr:unnamed protein product [Rotaria sordida]